MTAPTVTATITGTTLTTTTVQVTVRAPYVADDTYRFVVDADGEITKATIRAASGGRWNTIPAAAVDRLPAAVLDAVDDAVSF